MICNQPIKACRVYESFKTRVKPKEHIISKTKYCVTLDFVFENGVKQGFRSFRNKSSGLPGLAGSPELNSWLNEQIIIGKEIGNEI